MKVGYLEDWTASSLVRVQIVGETLEGQYVCKQLPDLMQSLNGTWFRPEPVSGIFLRDKSKIVNIHEEEI